MHRVVSASMLESDVVTTGALDVVALASSALDTLASYTLSALSALTSEDALRVTLALYEGCVQRFSGACVR